MPALKLMLAAMFRACWTAAVVPYEGQLEHLACVAFKLEDTIGSLMKCCVCIVGKP